MDLVTPWLLAERDRFALLHGDYRLDNMLFNRKTNAITVVDWQTLGVGLPARDLAYFTATSLRPDLRSASRKTLSTSITARCAATASPTTTVKDVGLTTGSVCHKHC